MADGKLILCVCGAGINTSLNAKTRIAEYMEEKGFHDVQVVHAMIGDIDPYKGRKNMLVVWMTQIDPNFGAPAVQGLPFLIGSRKAKEALLEEIAAKLSEISES